MLQSVNRLREETVEARILFTGDLCAIHRVERMLTDGDIAGAFGSTRALFQEADLTVVNLEAPLCRDLAPVPKLGPPFMADPRVAEALRDVPVHVACLANNHVMDRGADGLLQTLAALDGAGILYVGGGKTPAEAAAGLEVDVGGLAVVLLNSATVEGAIPLDGPGAARIDHLRCRRLVSESAGRGAFVIPILHTGKEQVPLPSPGMRQLCKELIDAGAAAVIGHHPHVPQGIEIYGNRPIVYSLGNFLFDWQEPEPETDVSFLFELGLSSNGVAEFRVHPVGKSRTGGAELLAGAAGKDFYALLADLSAPFADKLEYQTLWTEQCRGLFESWYLPRVKRMGDMDSEDEEKRRKAYLTLLNLLENDEHGEVLKRAVLERATGGAETDPIARERLDDWMVRMQGLGGS